MDEQDTLNRTVDLPTGGPPGPRPEPPPAPLRPRTGRRARIPLGIGAGVGLLVLLGGLLFYRAAAATNHVALSSTAKPVTVTEAQGAKFRARRRYVATVDPWLSARVGPQLVAAYVDTVLVRPGAVVKRGDVLATLDCRNASASTSAVANKARALEAKQTALAKESARITGLLDGGFVSANEVEQRQAETASMEAQLLATKAQLVGSTLEVGDCVLKAPFDGEVAERFVDPGAFVRPGQQIVLLVDRNTVRITTDVPENDFELVAAGTEIRARLLATGRTITGKVARRAPSADAATRTIHIEIDVADTARQIPSGTSAELTVDVGEPKPATEVPLAAASVRGKKATLFVVQGDVAKKVVVPVLGERDGNLYLDPSLAAGSRIVTQGRALLVDGDQVSAQEEAAAPAPAAQAPAATSRPSAP